MQYLPTRDTIFALVDGSDESAVRLSLDGGATTFDILVYGKVSPKPVTTA